MKTSSNTRTSPARDTWDAYTQEVLMSGTPQEQREEYDQVVVTLRGSMGDIVRALAQAIDAGLVSSIKSVTPCTLEEYGLCPLAALMDVGHPSHPLDPEQVLRTSGAPA